MAKPIRLGKAAGELNVGMSTLVEFLESKGVSIDASPNAKLAPEQYELLRTEFAADQNLKEQSKLTTVSHEKRETISIRDTREESTPATPEPAANEVAPTPVETPVAKVEVPEVKKEEESKMKVQVVGKIDLDKINSKTRPDKAKKPQLFPALKSPFRSKPIPTYNRHSQ